MRKSQIEQGRMYVATVNGEQTCVVVNKISRTTKGRTIYNVFETAAKRHHVFRSAARFVCLNSTDACANDGAGINDTPPHQEPSIGLASVLRGDRTLPRCTAPHLVVRARAGTGKTTTLVEGLKLVQGGTSPLTPSPQQAAVWDAMQLSTGKVRTICFVAFNKSIATELQQRVPAGCDAMTMHSMGFKAVGKACGRVKVNQYRVQDIVAELLGQDSRALQRDEKKRSMVRAVGRLVSLCKMNLLMDPDYDELAQLVSHYDVDISDSQSLVFDLVPQVLDRCKDVTRDGCIDFDDMIWLPVALELPVTKYDLLLVDEAQDLNRCQQQLALKAGSRLILCGDPKQAIYGFAGADSDSIPHLEQILSETDRGCTSLPLTVTRRCGKAIVEEARVLVPDFEAHPDNGPGTVLRAAYKGDGNYHTLATGGDMVLCRVNAPLVSECFKFIKDGVQANIQGRDIGQGLISTVTRLKASDVPDLVGRLSDWLHAEERKENAKRNSNPARLIALQDRHDCLLCFTNEAQSIAEVVSKIEQMFTNDRTTPGIMLSSVHKAKGLEADRVFLIEPEGASIPHPMAKSDWQRDQEMNLRYVAITRAAKVLVYVS